jgi:hypothetical protein
MSAPAALARLRSWVICPDAVADAVAALATAISSLSSSFKGEGLGGFMPFLFFLVWVACDSMRGRMR